MDIHSKDNFIILENEDVVELLHSAVKTYKFYHQDKTPTKIVVPLLLTVRDYNTPTMIPIEFAATMPTPTVEQDLAEKKGAPSVDSRQQRTSGRSGTTPAVGPGSNK